MKLREILDKYEKHGVSDMIVIKTYLIENRLEPEAIKMLAEMSESALRREKEKSSYIIEFTSYVNAILMNDIDEEAKIRFHQLCSIFLWRDLSEKELDEAGRIFSENDIQLCWKTFITYLMVNGRVGSEKDVTQMERDDLNRIRSILREAK